MADLSGAKADLPVGITGLTTAGVPTTPVGSDSNGNLNVNAQIVAPNSDLTASGSLTSTSSSVTLNINGITSLNIDVSGVWVGTIQVQQMTPSGTRVLPVQTLNSSVNTNGNITTGGNYRVLSVAAAPTVQAVFTSYTSGTANVTLRASSGIYAIEVYNQTASNLVTQSNLSDGSGNTVASYNSQLDTADIVNTSISSGSITVSTTAVAARVGSSNLANRKMLMISPVTNTVYLGASSAVTTATGIPVFPGQVVSFAFSANVTPYLISASSGTVNVFEGA